MDGELVDGDLEQRDGYVAMYSGLLRAWVIAPDDVQPPPPTTTYVVVDDVSLPDFMYPEIIEKLTPEIDWDKRVGDRIRQFLEWGKL